MKYLKRVLCLPRLILFTENKKKSQTAWRFFFSCGSGKEKKIDWFGESDFLLALNSFQALLIM